MGDTLIGLRRKQDFRKAAEGLPEEVFGFIIATSHSWTSKVDETEPIISFRLGGSGPQPETTSARAGTDRRNGQIAFDRKELGIILGLYGTMVAAGEWRDYALDFSRDKATFSVFRRTSEVPLYRIVKDPALARRQGLYAVIAQGGLILKRGHDLAQVLRVLTRQPKLSAV